MSMNPPRSRCSLICASKARRFEALTRLLAMMFGTATPRAMAPIMREALSPFTPAVTKLNICSPPVPGMVKRENRQRYISTPGTIGITLEMAMTW